MTIDRNIVLARLEVVIDSLGLPELDPKAIAEDDERLIDFAIKHGQSLDWLVMGDIRSYILMAAKIR
ncbi:hypothetical protein [Microvirga sp. VF16]|uniref:hypothetical protein n=1 Tax=Microvirga sp. VF16 TaxID=2807101 RepID=UPI00193D9091|nr:hypothetical protein [Microvirga sp. VF16]QRM27906.1 hypothetical protein JO965_16790 [Microvirga sp. VF16]